MSEIATIENLRMEEEYHDRESNQAQYAGRLKFACCRECGSTDGMQAAHHETLAETVSPVSWYKRPGNTEYLFYPCPRCNHWRIIPNGYAHVGLDISAWLDRDPMAPDYAALAAEPELVLASEDSCESAGLEG